MPHVYAPKAFRAFFQFARCDTIYEMRDNHVSAGRTIVQNIILKTLVEDFRLSPGLKTNPILYKLP